MSIKQRIEKLEGKASTGFCLVLPMYRDKDGIVEGRPKLPDDQVMSIQFFVDGDAAGSAIERKPGEALGALEERAYADVAMRTCEAPIMLRGWHLV